MQIAAVAQLNIFLVTARHMLQICDRKLEFLIQIIPTLKLYWETKTKV